MSLIIDTLKKLKKDNGNLSKQVLPPGITSDKENKNFRLIYILTGLSIVLGIGALGFFYYYLKYLNIPPQKTYIPHISKAEQKLKEKVENLDIAKALEKTKEENKKQPTTNGSLKNSQSHNVLTQKESKITNNYKSSSVIPTPPPIENKEKKNKEKNKNKLTLYEINSLIYKANKYISSGEYEKALRIYQKLYEVKPSKEILNNLLILYIKTGNEKEILKYLDKLKGKILMNLTIELIKQKKLDFALEVLNKLKVKDSYFYLSKGILLESQGYLKQAITNYELAHKLGETYIADYYYARALELEGRYKEALRKYKNIYNIIDNKKLKHIIRKRIEFLERIMR